MKRISLIPIFVLLLALALVISACGAQTEPEVVEVTRIVTETEVITEQVEVTRIVEGEVVTEQVEVTRIVEVPAEEEMAEEEMAEEEGAPQYGGTLRYARNFDGKTLDPHYSVQWAERYVLYCVYNTLVALDSEFNVVPELAESWDVSEDGTDLTFHLRDGVTFHDGTEFNAEAVKWNIERVLDPDNNSPQRSQLEPAIESVEVLDDLTVIFHLKQPFRPLLAALAERPGFIVSPTAVEEYGEDFGLNPVGTGPFRFVEWIPDSRVVVERNEDYWDEGMPYLDRIEFLHVPEGQVQMTMLRTGEADIIDELTPTLLPLLENDEGVKLAELQSFRFIGWQWDVTKPPFDNKLLRQALAYGVDREEIKESIFAGTGRAATHPEGGGWWYDPTLDTEGYTYDPEKAQELLAEAGYPDGFSFNLTVAGNEYWQTIGQAIQAQLSEIGVDAQIETVNPADSYQLVVEDKTDWTPTRWAPRADVHGRMFILFHSDGFANTTEFSNARVDELIDEAATIYDTSEAAPLYHEAERIVVEEAPYVYLHWPSEWAAMRTSVHDFEWIPDLIMRLRYLWIDQGS